MDSPLKTLLLLAPLSAITLHEIVLRRVEVDHLTIPIIAASSAAYWASVFRFGFSSTSLVFVAFWGTLSVWILLYRALWHPLRRFPGPFGARLSKWWTVKQTWDSKWGWHRVQQRLQREYGDYVRTGMWKSFVAILHHWGHCWLLVHSTIRLSERNEPWRKTTTTAHDRQRHLEERFLETSTDQLTMVN